MDSVKKFINDYRWVLVVLVLVIIGGFLIGSTPEAPLENNNQEEGENGEVMTATGEVSGENPVTVDEALNGSYHVDFLVKNVKLENGSYEEDLSGLNEKSSITVTTNPSSIALGKIDSDENSDAAVILYSTSVGDGVFTELTVLRNNNGAIEQIDSTYLGDRIKIDSINIEDGIITIAMKTHAADDDLCCPTQEKIRKYALLPGGFLVVLQ